MIKIIPVNSEDEIKTNFFMPKLIDLHEIDGKNESDVLSKFMAFYSVSKETSWILCRNQVFGIFGIREVNSKVAIPWLLSKEIPNNSYLSFMRNSKQVMELYQKEYDCLYNFTSIKNEVAHKWLQFLGFVIDFKNPVKISKDKTMIRFQWIKE